MSSPLPLTLDDKLNVIAQLCSALHYARAGESSIEIKPANLFLLPDGTVKLLDFGVAKLTTSTLTRQGDVLGSVSYMSPEQVSGSERIDGRSDIFSVGVLMYELLAGRKPFKGDSPTATIVKILREDPPPLETAVPGLPPRLIAAVRRALARARRSVRECRRA
jgi:serine/threonine-protein kinase